MPLLLYHIHKHGWLSYHTHIHRHGTPTTTTYTNMPTSTYNHTEPCHFTTAPQISMVPHTYHCTQAWSLPHYHTCMAFFTHWNHKHYTPTTPTHTARDSHNTIHKHSSFTILLFTVIPSLAYGQTGLSKRPFLHIFCMFSRHSSFSLIVWSTPIFVHVAACWPPSPSYCPLVFCSVFLTLKLFCAPETKLFYPRNLQKTCW